MRRKWRKIKIDTSTYDKNVANMSGIDPIVLKILASKNIVKKEEIYDILYKSINQFDFYHQYMKDTPEACAMVKECIDKDEVIVIYGDYDCDGATATITAMRILNYLGCRCYYYVNDRIKQGYGMKESGIDEIIEQYPEVSLILTVDNGISAHSAVDYAKSKGLKVIVTDHHEQQETLPNADYVINHKREDDPFYFKGLCGAGVIWRFFMYYFIEYHLDVEFLYSILDVVALGTVADVVPLLQENRAIVRHGLYLINKSDCLMQFKVLKELTGNKNITADTLGFQFAPMVNAVGRMEQDMRQVIDFFLESSIDRAISKANDLIALNNERKSISAEQTQLAELKLCYTLDDINLIETPIDEEEEFIETLSYHVGFDKSILLIGQNDIDGMLGVSVAYKMLKALSVNVSYVIMDHFDASEITHDYDLAISLMPLSHKDQECIKEKGDLILIQKDYLDNKEPYIMTPKENIEPSSVSYLLWRLLVAFIVIFEEGLYQEHQEEFLSYLQFIALTIPCDLNHPLLNKENRVMVREGINQVNLKELEEMQNILKELSITKISPEIYLAYLKVTLDEMSKNIIHCVNFIEYFNEKAERVKNNLFIRLPFTKLAPRKIDESLMINIKPELKPLNKVIIVASKDFGDGIIGLIAGRLKEKYNRPVFAFHIGENAMKGSGRSIEAFHLKKVLDRCSDLLLGYGGHTLAAGLSLDPKHFDAFCERINEIADELLTDDDLVRVVSYVDEMSESQINEDFISSLEVLEPYGEGFRSPLFKIKNIELAEEGRATGESKVHLKMISKKGTPLIAWNYYDTYVEMGRPLEIMGIGVPIKNEFLGKISYEFRFTEDNFYKC